MSTIENLGNTTTVRIGEPSDQEVDNYSRKIAVIYEGGVIPLLGEIGAYDEEGRHEIAGANKHTVIDAEVYGGEIYLLSRAPVANYYTVGKYDLFTGRQTGSWDSGLFDWTESPGARTTPYTEDWTGYEGLRREFIRFREQFSFLNIPSHNTEDIQSTPTDSPSTSPSPGLSPILENIQTEDGFRYLSNADDSLTGQADIKMRMLGGNDYLEVTGGNNYANGNMGEDTIILYGVFGEYLGGKGSDTIEVYGAEEGTSVNGNMGKDYITGTVAGVTYRGGKENDMLAISQGDVWGDKGADTFRALAGEGFAAIQDYTIGEDKVEIEMDGSWNNFGDGLMFIDNSGDQLMLLLGINDVEQVTRV